ncbi:helix-turn-helix domain-containing protein [Anaerovibrio lipolyticus]|uniref:helix-turn-helix domain-containing protein n=1 Tax=Anaerovibrio lipolyticus TaxID=82374 RepID=UPI002286B81D|nr:helix-turn-helix domain-containing protein [Anaerovibrio lipolyticus]
MSINRRINLLRKQLGMIQQDFANKIGVQRVTISWMEKEGNTITKQNIKIICDTFNVSETWLLNGEGEMFRPADKPDILDRLQQELKLTSQEMEIIRTFVELSPEQRRMGIEFVQTFTSKLSDVASALQEKKSKKNDVSESDTSKNGNINNLDSCHQTASPARENSAPPADNSRPESLTDEEWQLIQMARQEKRQASQTSSSTSSDIA